MRAIRLGALAIGWLLGCATPPASIGPFYGPGHLSGDPNVEGEWLSLADTARGVALTVRRTGYFRYHVVQTEWSDTLEYTAYTFTLGAGHGVDLTAAGLLPKSLMLPIHIFGQYAVQGDTLWFGYASDRTWLERLQGSGSHGIQWLLSHDSSGLLLSGWPDSLHAIALELRADTTVDWNVRGFLRRRLPAGGGDVAAVSEH